jgi:hypothetical protein
MALVGTPSDDVEAVLATGRTDVTTIFVSMSARHPDGDDAEYLQWHTLDHRPEQSRLATIRGSLRLVSTPACRRARAVCDERYEAVDHVMTYFFADIGGLEEFNDLAIALADAGRIPYLLPLVERGVYGVEGMVAAPRVKVGADVLPWWPARGVYLLVERGEATPTDLAAVPGVAGAWWATTVASDPLFSTAEIGQQVTYCFLDDDPVATAKRLAPVLEARWSSGVVTPRFAAPFHTLVPHAWDRHIP